MDSASVQTDSDSPRVSTEVVEMARRCLCQSPYRAIQRVACEYADGTLVLRGRVPSYYEKILAQEAVARLGGVTRIVNDIKVRWPAAEL